MTRNPNEFKYFDPQLGMTYNKKCPNCGCDTFASERIETVYEGKLWLTNWPKSNGRHGIVGVLHSDMNSDKSGVWCEPCYVTEIKAID